MSKCGLCNEYYTEEFKIPKILPCGHNYCLICLIDRFQKFNVFLCNQCNYSIRDMNLIKKLPNNYGIIDCIRENRNRLTNIPVQRPITQPYVYENIDQSAIAARNQNNLAGLVQYFQNADVLDTMHDFFGESRANERRSPQARRIGDVEINEKGIFKEKSPVRQQSVDLCIMPGCSNPKAWMSGFKQQFCSLGCANAFGNFPRLMRNDVGNNGLIIDNYQGEVGGNPQIQMGNGGNQVFRTHIGNGEPSRGQNVYSTHLLPEFMQQQLQQQSQQQPEQQQPLNNPQIGSPHLFGKVTREELLKFYDKSPAVGLNPPNSTPQQNNFQTLQPIKYDRRSLSPTRESVLVGTPRKPMGVNAMFFNDFTTPLNNNNNNNNNNGVSPMMDSGFEKCSVATCQNRRSKNFGPGFPFCGLRCMNLAQTINQRTQLLE